VSKEHWQQKLLHYNWKESRLAKTADYTARVLLIVLLLDESLQVFNEWGSPVPYAGFITKFLSLPFISYSLFIANMVILLPASYSIINSLLERKLTEGSPDLSLSQITERSDYAKRYALLSAFFMLACSLPFVVLQCLIWDEFSLSGAYIFSATTPLLIIEFLMLTGNLFLFQKRLKDLSGQNPSHDPKSILARNVSLLTLFFITFSQTMITKALVLISLISGLRKIGFKILKRIPPEGMTSEVSLANVQMTDRFRFFAFMFLVTTILSFIFLWQMAVTPFSPLGSIYIKPVTISMLYMSFIILYIFIEGDTRKYRKYKTVAWLVYSFFILYITPVLLPEIYQPGNSEVTSIWIIADLPGIGASSVIIVLAFLQLISIISFSMHFQAEARKTEFIEKKQYYTDEFISYYLIETPYRNLILVTVTVLVIYNLALSTELPIQILPEIIVYILSFPPAAVFILGSLMPRNGIFQTVHTHGGMEAVEHLRSQYPFLRLHKEWNDNRINPFGLLIKAASWLIVWIISFSSISLTISHASSSDFSVSREVKYQTESVSTYLLDADNYFILNDSLRITGYDKKSGTELFSFTNLNGPTRVIQENDSLYWLLDNSTVSLRNIRKDEAVFRHNSVGTKSVNTPNLFLNDSTAAIIDSAGFSVFNRYSLQPVTSIINTNTAFPIARGGSFVWQDEATDIWLLSSGKATPLSVHLFDTLHTIFSFPDVVFGLSATALHYIDHRAKNQWKFQLSENADVKNASIDCEITDSVLVVGIDEETFAFESFSGRLLWQKPRNIIQTKTKYPYDYSRYFFLTNRLLHLHGKSLFLYTGDNTVETIDIRSGLQTGEIEFLFGRPSCMKIVDNFLVLVTPVFIMEYDLSEQHPLKTDAHIVALKQHYEDTFEPAEWIVPTDIIKNGNGYILSIRRGLIWLER